MSTDYYDSLDDYITDVIAAREANRADRAVADGTCGTCQIMPRGKDRRECHTCRRIRSQGAAV